MKKLGTVALALSLTATLAAPAFATEAPPIPTAPLTYAGSITVNGVKLDTSKLPAAAGIPMRLVAESDHGSASWYEEDNTGWFFLENANIIVNFADNTVQIGEETAKDVKAEVKDGVTFLPVSVLEGIEGYTVATADDGAVTITTPNNDPLIQAGYAIIDGAELASGMKSDAKAFFENYGLKDYDKNIESAVTFQGMNITPDSLVVAKLAKGGDVDAVKTALETYRKSLEDTFSWYLSQNLPKVQDARTVVSGDYVLFLIGDNADKGVEIFNAFVAEQGK